MAKPRGLGRGIESLIPSAPKPPPPQQAAVEPDSPPAGPPAPGAVWEARLSEISPNRWQPRREFDEEGLKELAESIAAFGLMNPLVVRRRDDGTLELIAGERRLRAMRDVLKRESAPVRLMDVGDAAMREHALVENLHREDLNPIEEAWAYQELRREHGLTHEEIASRLKVSRSKITNTMRLMELPEEVRQMVVDGTLPAGSARALLSMKESLSQIRLARRAVEEGLNTRQVEQLAAGKAKDKAEPPPAAEPADPRRPPHIAHLEDRLRRHFASKVTVEDNQGKGKIILEYYSVEEAQRLLDRMGLTPE